MDQEATGWRLAGSRSRIGPGDLARRFRAYCRRRGGFGAALVMGLRERMTWENCPFCCGVVVGFMVVALQ